MLKWTTLIDVPICANRLIGVSGLIFAVVDDNVTVEEAIANKGQTVSFGNNFKKILIYQETRISMSRN